MQPSNFDRANTNLGPPDGVGEEECGTLRVWRGSDDIGRDVVISCWKPTQDEIEEIQRTGRVWLWVWGKSAPPVGLDGFSPWKDYPDENP